MLNRDNSQFVWPLKDPALSKALKLKKILEQMDLSCPGGLVELSPYWPISHDWYPMRLSCCRKTEASTLAQKKLAKKNYRFEVGGQRSRAAAEGLEGVWLG